jgi:hypothetical protein
MSASGVSADEILAKLKRLEISNAVVDRDIYAANLLKRVKSRSRRYKQILVVAGCS